MIKKLLIALGVSISTAALGLVGAWAFNPDDGAVAHSETLWRIFGVPAEIAWAATAALLAVLLLVLFARLAGWSLRILRAI